MEFIYIKQKQAWNNFAFEGENIEKIYSCRINEEKTKIIGKEINKKTFLNILLEI